MRALAPGLTLDSAGTGNWHVGEPPYAPMQAAAAARGLDLSGLRARQFTAADFDAFDLIVAMDRKNLADIAALRPLGHPTPLRTMAARDVPDPYYTRDFDGCLDLLERANRSLLADISGWQDR